MSTASLPPHITVAPPPPELELERDDDRDFYRRPDYRHRGYDEVDPRPLISTTWPVRIEASTPEALLAKQWACSGSPDSTRYQEATRFRDMSSMTWEEARAAFNRLFVARPSNDVALAEFVLTGATFEPFMGRKGEHAPMLRTNMHSAIKGILQRGLSHALETADTNATVTRPADRRAPPGG